MSFMHNDRDSASLNIQVIERLYVVTALLKKKGDQKIFKKFGITTSLFAILTKIATGKTTGTELQKYIEGTPASITQKLGQLEERGIIARRLDEADKRKWIFEITDEGNRILSEIYPIYEAQLAELFANYDESTKDDFLATLLELEERLR
jgi:DNA-binding MarR family transcriptional regulator